MEYQPGICDRAGCIFCGSDRAAYERSRNGDDPANAADSTALWSPWSAAIPFEVTGSNNHGDPVISLSKRIYAPDEEIPIVYANGPGNAKDWIGIYAKEQTPGGPAASSWAYVTGMGGTMNLAAELAAGTEGFAAFFSNDGYTEIAPRVPFFVGSQATLSADKQIYEEGDTVQLSFADGPAGVLDWVGIYQVGKAPEENYSDDWQYLNGSRTAPAAGIADGQLRFANLPKGYYYATYMVNGDYFEVSERVGFAVGNDISSLSMESKIISQGDDFIVSFSDGPGTPKDWMGLFKRGETPGVDTLTHYLYVEGKTSGSVTFNLPTLPPGEYFLALFVDDSYTEVSPRLNITVKTL